MGVGVLVFGQLHGPLRKRNLCKLQIVGLKANPTGLGQYYHRGILTPQP
jgi:hypothetical protein